MAETSSIEWTDATWNPVTGCSVVSPGCTNCYAMKVAGTRLKNHGSRKGLTTPSKAGPVWNGQVRFNQEWIEQPLTWAKARRIFVCAHGDLFHESVPTDWIAWVYGVAIAAVHLRGHTFQILTKRSARARELLNSDSFWDMANDYAGSYVMERVDALHRRSDDARATLDDYSPERPPPGIWLGVSAEDQERLDERVPELLATPAVVRFLSAEPLLSGLRLRGTSADGRRQWDYLTGETGVMYADGPDFDAGPRLDWVIVGGESGNGARPMHPDWARSIRDQCAAACVAYFFKQWGTWATLYDRDKDDPDWRDAAELAQRWPNGRWLNLAGGQGFHGERVVYVAPLGKSATKHHGLDGVTHHAMPAVGGD